MKVPEGWKLLYLKNIIECDPQNGYSPNCSDKPNGRWILGLGNLTDSGFNPQNAKPAPIDDPKVDQFRLKSGDFIISRSNTPEKVGRTALFRGEIKNCSYPDLMMKFRLNEDVANTEFIENLLSSRKIQQYYKSRAAGSSNTMVKINKTTVKKTPILLPPLPEQKAIADILSTWDEAIEKTEKLMKEKEKEKEHLIHEIIIEPALNGKWSELLAGKLFEERRERNCNNLTLLSITGKEGVIPRDETNRKDSSNKDKSKYLRICPGDIGYNTMRMWQGVSALSELEGIVSPAYTIVTPKKGLHPKFVAYLFKTPFIIHRFYRYSQGLTSDTWNLKFHHFNKIKIPLPSLAEQKQIAETLNVVQEKIKLLKQLAEKYKKQKRGLMQKLLTGEWRLKKEAIKKHMEA